MGKIVKFCTKCEEGFAEKFGFCPNCGENLKAFEMNPVHDEVVKTPSLGASEVVRDTPPAASFETARLTEEQAAQASTAFSDDDILELNSVDVAEEPVNLLKAKTPAASNGNGNGNGHHAETVSYNVSLDDKPSADDVDGGYSPTVIEEKDQQLRNGLLAGFGAFFAFALIVGVVWSLFLYSFPVYALDEGSMFAFVGPIEDTPVEREDPPKKNKDEGGGGGGGGKDNPTPVNKGRLPTQMENPPNQLLTVTQMTKPEFVVQNATKGNIKREMTDKPIGLPNGLSEDTLSGGPGSGGGIGGGRGSGAGGGIGGGEGNGNGNGSGNGDGNGNGDGKGDGDNEPTLAKKEKEPPKAAVAGVSAPIKILSKPQARYTDEGRKNNIQGTVTLKVTFTASGTIGSISTVSGLPYGLTEKAIEAARQIRFEPAKRNGVPYALTKTVSYSFTIY